MISNGHGYWTSYIVSTKFAIVISFFSLYCVISNHPVMVSIIVTDFKYQSLSPFFTYLKGPMRSTQRLFHSIYNAIFAGILPYFNIDCFVCWRMSHSMTSFITAYLMLAVQILVSSCLLSIQYCIKEICVTSFHNVYL